VTWWMSEFGGECGDDHPGFPENGHGRKSILCRSRGCIDSRTWHSRCIRSGYIRGSDHRVRIMLV